MSTPTHAERAEADIAGDWKIAEERFKDAPYAYYSGCLLSRLRYLAAEMDELLAKQQARH